ncbi:MAG: PEP-CTERM sorting domain-containing protein [Chthoniobacterales bacterium]
MSSPLFRKGKYLAIAILIGVCTSGFADYKDDIGYTQLVLELGGSIPTGTGVNVTQIEAPLTNGGTNYAPDTTNSAFTGKTFIFPVSGSTVSSHATTVGGYFYGSNSTAPGISQVTVFNVNDWIGSSSLRTSLPIAPAISTGKVQNSSWIGTTDTGSVDTEILERYDYQINRDGVIAVVGVNNGVSSVPNLLAAGYNSIAVGLSSGNSSSGTTSPTLSFIYGNPRQKPDIVVPTDATSWATAIVSSSAALLVSSAPNANAMRPEVIRATLMAGATKTGLGGTWTHTQTVPLDSTYGAGQLNIYNSYHIQQAGQFAGQTTAVSMVGNTGWDLGTAQSASPEYYFFHVSTLSDFSAVLTWNVNVSANFNWSTITPTLANLDLFLYNANGLTIGSLVDQSISGAASSTSENVELLWEQNLAVGDYAIKITSDTTQQYGFAWQTIPEPSTWMLLIFGVIFTGVMIRRSQSAASVG